jgi:alkylation response protein AidB-like acyl-CoA dehydrogenase
LVNIAHGHTFNEVYFENVRVPKQNIIGKKNQGWVVAMATLDYERSGGATRVGAARRWLEEFAQFVNEKKSNCQIINNEALIRDSLAQLAVDIDVMRLLSYRVLHEQSKGRIPNWEAAMLHTFSSELMKRLSRLGMRILGPYGQLGMESEYAQLRGMVQRDYLYTPGWTLAGGTAEIHRNVIAWRALGLPRM